MTRDRESAEQLKARVREHWSREPCGTRGLDVTQILEALAEQTRERYRVDRHIPRFAGFEAGRGKRVLEIGVGAGVDFIQWVKGGADAVGIDLTEESIALTRARLAALGLQGRAQLRVADAEHLPFADDSFDIVYAYGVLHHSPDTRRALAEVHRVLRPEGRALLMIYHVPSWTGFMLWALHGAARLRPLSMTPRRAIYEHLESPGTKAYTLGETRALLSSFRSVELETVLLAGDVLDMPPSRRYQGRLHRLLWRLYPRRLIRLFGARLGLGLLIRAWK